MTRPALALSALLALAAPLAAHAQSSDDRAPTPEETTLIDEALRAEGFTSWEEVEMDDGVWEIDDAVGADGQRHDLTLDMGYAVIKRDDD